MQTNYCQELSRNRLIGYRKPGFVKSQGYRIEISPLKGLVTAKLVGEEIAVSKAVKIMHETRLQPYYYFPKDAIDPKLLTRSNFRTFCPFKGTASYWHVKTPKGIIENGAWAYETPLEESLEISGMLSFSKDVADEYKFENPPRMNLNHDGHISSPLTDWILREAAYCSSRQELVSLLGAKFIEAGIAVSRMNITIWSLHPEIAGVNFRWLRETGEVTVSEPSHDIFTHPGYINSPLNLVTQGLGGVRQPLNVEKTEFQFPIMEELQAEGATDYVAMPLRFSDGQFHSMTMACDHENGFTTENLGLVFECSAVISRYFEVLTLRKNATTLMDTYLGKRTGEKVLSGDIRRGQGEDIQAVILFSDLRNSTRLAEELPRNQYLDLLNRYFEIVLDPVNEHGGEVLKFIGDAVLAIFPVSNDTHDHSDQACAALLAARSAIQSVVNEIDQFKKSGSSDIDLGLSLHIGEVTYGNVGGQNRLDFTVIGPAVNLASRVESLCKSSGHRILMSKDFVEALESGTDPTPKIKSVGKHSLDGISGNQEIFALA